MTSVPGTISVKTQRKAWLEDGCVHAKGLNCEESCCLDSFITVKCSLPGSNFGRASVSTLLSSALTRINTINCIYLICWCINLHWHVYYPFHFRHLFGCIYCCLDGTAFSLCSWSRHQLPLYFCTSLYTDGVSNSDIRPEGDIGPKLWLYVQDPHHWQQQRGQNLFPVPLRWRLLHAGLCQHGGHWFQGENHLQEWQEDQITDLGKTLWSVRLPG